MVSLVRCRAGSKLYNVSLFGVRPTRTDGGYAFALEPIKHQIFLHIPSSVLHTKNYTGNLFLN